MDTQTNITKTLTSEEDIREFIALHANEIKGLYYDRYYKNGGWNGLLDAISEVQKRHNVEIYYEDAVSNEINPLAGKNVFERIIDEEL